MRKMSRFLLLAVVVLAGALLLAGVDLGVAQAQTPQPGDQACLDCHATPAQVTSLPNGEQLYISIDTEDFLASVHGQEAIACTACHQEIEGYPHPKFNAATRREYTLNSKDTCLACHQEQSFPDDIHTQLLEEGNQNVAVCADCHNPHTQPRVTGEDGALLVSKGQIAQTCARCHSQIYNEYANSVHGKAAIEDNNPDVPTCIDCHGVHQITDPRTTQYRLASPEMCGKCHTDEKMMAPYGLSTAVYDTYVADFHGTTVTLFRQDSPEGASNKAVCYDCHGVHNIASMKDPEKSLQVKANILAACQRCHPDATENFPDSWLSHYIPTRERTPLVYYVNLFYKIFIPLVLVPMTIFVLSDIYRRVFRPKAHATAVEQPEQTAQTDDNEQKGA